MPSIIYKFDQSTATVIFEDFTESEKNRIIELFGSIEYITIDVIENICIRLTTHSSNREELLNTVIGEFGQEFLYV